MPRAMSINKIHLDLPVDLIPEDDGTYTLRCYYTMTSEDEKGRTTHLPHTATGPLLTVPGRGLVPYCQITVPKSTPLGKATDALMDALRRQEGLTHKDDKIALQAPGAY